MPRPSKGPRLWKRPERSTKGRKEKSVWIILDGAKQISTGCPAYKTDKAPPAEALAFLADYLAGIHKTPREKRDIEVVDFADVLSIYHDDRRDGFELELYKKRFDAQILRLTLYFGGKMLSEMSDKLCDGYVNSRSGPGGARRDLETLRAAIGHHAEKGYHHGVVTVTLPDKGKPRKRWLTRAEAAHLIWTCWRYREIQTAHRGEHKGKKIATDKHPLRHLARFILIGMYTGTRAGAIATASPHREEGRSWVDLDEGIFHRLALGRRETKKRQPKIKLPPRLLAHMRRWHDKGIIANHFVEWHGQGVSSVKTGFATAIRLSGLSTKDGNITPHTLRHTAATWLMQNGCDLWEASGYLGMSIQTLIDVYGHHHPDFMSEAVEAITRKNKKNATITKAVSLGETLGDRKTRRANAR